MGDEAELVRYLSQHALLDARSIVEGNLTVSDASRRHRNFRVTRDGACSYFVKRGSDEERSAALAREARVYGYLGSEPGNASFAPYLPRLHAYDPSERLLVVELMPEAENLREFHSRRGAFPVSMAARLARALATLHNGTRAPLSPGLRALARPAPWIFSAHEPHADMLEDLSASAVRLIKLVQQAPLFGESLRELRGVWERECLIHFDLKWDNCIVCRNDPRALQIVDWESGGLGDPCWDVGSVFMDYLSCWISSIPVTGEAPPEQFPALARYPLARMQPAMRSFWNVYARLRGFDRATSGEKLLRATRYCAARLLQTAFEQAQHAARLTGNLVLLLQLGFNVMQRPGAAVADILGIPFEQ